MNFSKTLSASIFAVTSVLALPHAAFAHSLVTHQVGDRAEGGVVFYVNRLGTHGLAAAVSDQRQDIPVKTRGHSHTGMFCSNPDLFDAEGELYTDWRLPSRNELKRLYEVRAQVGNFIEKEAATYVSGNMNTGDGMWVKSFRDGEEFKVSTDRFRHIDSSTVRTLNIRCIRSF